MIPTKVYESVKYASNINHGADLKRKNKTYSLKLGYIHTNNIVTATLYIHCNDADLSKYEHRGYDIYPTSPHSPAFACKKIPLSSVPDSQENEWKCWDEY